MLPTELRRHPRRTRSVLCALAIATAACTGTADQATVEHPNQYTPIGTLDAPATTTTAPPATTTSTTMPRPVEVAAPARSTLVVDGVGDVNLDPGFVRSFRTEGYDYAWSGLGGMFVRDGLTIVNLECSAGPGSTPWDKKWNFTCDDTAYPSAAEAGVDVANQANNHGADFGFDAMLAGADLLRASGITPVGAGIDRTAAYTPAFFSVDGWTVAVIGVSAVGPESGSWTAREDRPGVASATDVAAVADAIASAHREADLVFVTVHWGEEGDTDPRGWVRTLGEAYVDAGADGVFGHHSHRLGPLEWYNGKPIAWGLGNFVWQAYPAAATRTAVARFVFEPDGRIGACLIPVVIERTGHPVVQTGDGTACAVDRFD